MPSLKNRRFSSHREHRGHGEGHKGKMPSLKNRRFSSHGGYRERMPRLKAKDLVRTEGTEGTERTQRKNA